MRVFVYWNLNRDCFSVRALEGERKGKVIAHARSVELRDVTFSVGHAGRLQVLNGGHKQVHAGMRGTLVAIDTAADTAGMHRITYNPRQHATFIRRQDLKPMAHAARVIGLTTTDNRADCHATCED